MGYLEDLRELEEQERGDSRSLALKAVRRGKREEKPDKIAPYRGNPAPIEPDRV